MPDFKTLESNIVEIIDELKALCQPHGFRGDTKEEKIITSIFLYKFLNDKFMYNINEFISTEKIDLTFDELLENKDNYLDYFYMKYSDEIALEKEDTIGYLANNSSKDNFHKYFNKALENISNNPKNELFGIITSEGTKEPLFEPIINDVKKDKDTFARKVIAILSQEKFDFSEAFNENFDFYSRIFEYLINDYNVASGTYAEYFTPQAISKIIAKILVNMSPVEDKSYDIYDPSAGSGSLILHLANELGEGLFGSKAQVFTQDISEKSSRFLRINLLLNGLSDSLEHIIQGDTLLAPAHYNDENDFTSGIKTFDYITSNPPFKMDFSLTRNEIENRWQDSEERDGIKRFFAGVPKIPKKKKKSMEVYLCFIQHILWSLKENGKAAIVVPTGFITAVNGIPRTIRETIIDKKWLKGVISMPPNIFANTGTNVSVLFIDKSNKEGEVMLIDASTLGSKEKIDDKQKTVLNSDEVKLIEDTFINKEVIDEFSVKVSYEEIKDKSYSFSAPQFFEIKMEYEEITEQEFNAKVLGLQEELSSLFKKSNELNKKIDINLKELKFE